MTSPNNNLHKTISQLLAEARAGDDSALGQLLKDCRPYLLLVANEEFPQQLQAKLSPSDLVQETFLEAHRQFASFRGVGEEQLRAWLRQILRNNIVDCTRHYRANSKRAVDKEFAIQDTPQADLVAAVSGPDDTPSKQLMRQEWREQLHKALARLPKDSRQIIQWRNYDLLTFAEIGRRLGCSRDVARNAWARAIQLLTTANAEE